MNSTKPPLRTTAPFLAIGLAFLPISIATRQTAFLVIGLAFLTIALVLLVKGPKKP